MRDLVAHSVARRPGTLGKLVVEKSYFMPYMDESCLEKHWPEASEHLSHYQAVCRATVLHVLRKMQEAGVKIPNASALTDIVKSDKVRETLGNVGIV